MTDPDYQPVVELFRESLAARLFGAIGNGIGSAADESTVIARIRPMAIEWSTTRLDRRITLIAMLTAVASIAHLALRALLPRYSISGLPWWWNVSAAVIALVVVALAAPLAKAWSESTPAAIWRRLIAF